ncbi:MAG: aldo/keto reductase [Gemmataceae bacterium]|nr:aldo/keto reductase [Gemmataceae bacterium]
MKRREFFHSVSAAGAAPLLAGGLVTPASAADADAAAPLPRVDPAQIVTRGDMQYRKLGTTGTEVSCIGLGGHHIGRPKDEAESIKLIRAAIDAGITFMDNSWDYHDGLSELRMGKALLDGYRKKVFLMTKIDGRTRAAAAKQIDQCLLRLRVDTIDLVQHHEMIRMEDADRIFGEDGAQEAVEAARKAGKIRFVGFTGHKDPLVHLRTLDVARDHGFHFDTAQMPLNVMDAHFRSFARKVLPVLVKEGVGVLGMKSMGDGNILKSETVTPAECLRYALTLSTSVVITGIESTDRLKQALEVVKDFKPLTEEQVAAILDKTKKAAGKGEYERFKTGVQFDSTATHPEWLG